MAFPYMRPRRLRKSEPIRNMVREIELGVNDLMYPIFVMPGEDIKNPIEALSGQFHWSIDRLKEIIDRVVTLKIPAVMLFGVSSCKDAEGSESYDDNGVIQQAVMEIKKLAPDLVVVTDVCLCGYTDHGHCGLLDENIIDNDKTLNVLGKIAVSHAKAGADIVAPSGMMDGMISAIRDALDLEGFSSISIMSYAVKYASAFYGPFREASGTALKGDRKTYQMDYANKKEALREALLDEQEGADYLMVKPALAYLDIISEVSQNTHLPMVAYHVSGEYAMVKAAAEKGWVDERAVMLESLIAMKRAGSNIIITYAALDVAGWISE
ncbi:porphobilinogen synthase [Francisellaceae bacterium]|nr:porphobilinogen synthase [Francisellaceae bacterium]